MKTTIKDFGKGYTLITLTNKNNVTLSFSDLGARIVSMKVPKNEEMRELILGFDSAEEYLEKDLFIGATIGRVAGRIAKGQFSIDEVAYQVQTNNNGNTLHGGTPSFDAKKWDFEISENENSSSVAFTLKSPDGENGFPGELVSSVTYTLDDENVWTVSYLAETDKATLFNPTNHVYFNLTGEVTKTVENHTLQINSDEFLPTSPDDNTVLGEVSDVSGTAFDFREPVYLREVFVSNFPQKLQVDGIDHPFLLNEVVEDVPNAVLTLPEDEISVEVFTEEIAVVIFTANFGEGAFIMRGESLADHAGITFETQLPPGFEEEMILRPDEEYRTTTKFKINY